ncbi:glycosyltransferase family 2 protein [Oleiharenicola lentus]|uniref:glycosyltransferase family 2 protein n=1 Tax=Oleiharenicola lentus TaxID=2508720 RepID=UPI003F66BEBF
MSAQTTLLIPCYNAARFLPRLMANVAKMSVSFDEVLAYDDGSTDDTVAVARSLGLTILTPNANGGVSRARNRLVEAAQTEWIHFHDADDRISPDYLRKLGPLADDLTDVVSCDADWIGEEDEALHVAWRYDVDALARDPAEHLLAHPMGLNNSLVRRSAWLKIGGCDETLAMWEDADVHFRLALNGARWRHMPEVLTWSLRNAASFSHDYRRNWRCRLAALEKYSQQPAMRRVSATIASEAERAAEQLLALGEKAAAKSALALASSLGRTVPTTNNPLLRAVRAVLPPITTLAIQQRIRRR